jgi:hypothetical protein
MEERTRQRSDRHDAPAAPPAVTSEGEPSSTRALTFSQEIRARIDRQLGRNAARTHAFRRQSGGE